MATSPISGGAANEKLLKSYSDFRKDTEETESDDDAVHHHFGAAGYDNFQHGRYGDPHGKDTRDRRTWELAYHVEGAI